MKSYLQKKSFNNIFVVQDRNYWPAVEQFCSAENDLVLVIDFGLYAYLQKSGFTVEFLQRYLEPNYVQELNFQMHGFLDSWYRNSQGEDYFSFDGLSIGDAFLLGILSEITYFCHFFIYFQHLHLFAFNTVYTAVQPDIEEIFKKTTVPFTPVKATLDQEQPSYLFPIKKWMSEAVNPSSWKMKVKNLAASGFDLLFWFTDKIRPARKRIFIQEYHPTFGIIQKLKETTGVQIITSNYSGLAKILGERRVWYRKHKSAQQKAAVFLQQFRQEAIPVWDVFGANISSHLFQIIYKVLDRELPEALSDLESIRHFFAANKPVVMVPICDIWLRNRLLMHYCKKEQIPLFFIFNGLLALTFYRDAKDSDWVNCYGPSAKALYLNNEDRALCLGDPRMDQYANHPKKEINRVDPVIIIGTSAFNLIDLNSHLSVEFEFLFEIFTALRQISAEGKRFSLKLKVRANGYVHLYKSFVQEYFPDLAVTFYQNEPFNEVIQEADLYLSFYSQTLIEAASLGIPVIYYKNDRQIMLPPFDGHNELVTTYTPQQLLECLHKFYAGCQSLQAFGQPEVLQNYVGSLDGHSTERNVEFIKKLAGI